MSSTGTTRILVPNILQKTKCNAFTLRHSIIDFSLCNPQAIFQPSSFCLYCPAFIVRYICLWVRLHVGICLEIIEGNGSGPAHSFAQLWTGGTKMSPNVKPYAVRPHDYPYFLCLLPMCKHDLQSCRRHPLFGLSSLFPQISPMDFTSATSACPIDSITWGQTIGRHALSKYTVIFLT